MWSLRRREQPYHDGSAACWPINHVTSRQRSHRPNFLLTWSQSPVVCNMRFFLSWPGLPMDILMWVFPSLSFLWYASSPSTSPCSRGPMQSPWPLPRSRGHGNGCASSLPLFFLRSTPGILPWSLYSDGPLSSWPQPLEAETPLPAKTQGRTLDRPFNFYPARSVARKCAPHPQKAHAGASLCRGLWWFRGGFGSHRSKPHGWGNSAGELE